MYREIEFKINYRTGEKTYLSVDAQSVETKDGVQYATGINQVSYQIDWIDNSLLQSTGMFDRDGKKIVHGDILKNVETEKHYEVMFACGAFFIIEDEDENSDRILLTEALVMKMQIVGDIFNNPELVQTWIVEEDFINKIAEQQTKNNETN